MSGAELNTLSALEKKYGPRFKPAKLLVGQSYNHFETQETMGSPYGFMGRAALEMMGLA